MHAYSNPKRERDPQTLPDLDIFQLSAEEQAELGCYEDEHWELHEQFPLMGFNSREREKAIAHMIQACGLTGGWYWQSCFPGCMPDSDPVGPFDSYDEALADAREGVEDEAE